MGNGGPAFRWTSGSGVQNLLSLLSANGASSSLKGWATLVQATGISSNGTVIVGWGQNPQDKAEAFIATVPTSVK